MEELIRRRVLLDEFKWLKSVVNESSKDEIEDVIQRIKNAPAVDAVSKSLYDQIKLERDIALEQLNELGISFGEKMVRCKDCKYRGDYNCPMYSEEYVEWDDDGYHEWECVEHDRTHDEGFCDMGVRWE